MLKLRRISIYYLTAIFILGAIYFLMALLLSEPDEYVDSKYKLSVMEQAIHSSENQGQCRIPELPISSPEMMLFIHDEPPIECKTEEDWVACYLSTCSINSIAISKYGEITCDFSEIIRNDDYTIGYGPTTRTSGAYQLVQSDFLNAKCWNEHWTTWTGIVYGMHETVVQTTTDHSRTIDQQPLNVLMFGLDSLSKNAFIRKLPQTYEYLTKTLKADILQGYNILGDGTPQALIPILTGFTELELPETRKRMSGSQHVDVYPFVWDSFERMGYVTAFNEDIPSVGTFTYRLNGFSKQPTSHYMRTYYLAIEPELGNYQKLCVGHTPRHNVMLDYTSQFMKAYAQYPHFVFSFHGELSHDSINLVGAADSDLYSWLNKLKVDGILNNTVLIMMSDHGNRFADVRNTLQGKLEERLPFFSFTFPEWFKQKHKIKYEIFQENMERLTTPFDVHATLEDILRIQSPFYSEAIPQSKSMRAISLFDRIPESRSCADAYIEPHWCVCLNWRQINDTRQETIARVAHAVVDAINHHTSGQYQAMCARLTLYEINWAAKLAPHDNLLRFKQSKDGDGFLADLTSQTHITSEMYQIKITVNPGKSIFEASVLHRLSTHEFQVKMTDISRVNKYGSQAACILESNPELRKYCYCRND